MTSYILLAFLLRCICRCHIPLLYCRTLTFHLVILYRTFPATTTVITYGRSYHVIGEHRICLSFPSLRRAMLVQSFNLIAGLDDDYLERRYGVCRLLRTTAREGSWFLPLFRSRARRRRDCWIWIEKLAKQMLEVEEDGRGARTLALLEMVDVQVASPDSTVCLLRNLLA